MTLYVFTRLVLWLWEFPWPPGECLREALAFMSALTIPFEALGIVALVAWWIDKKRG